MTKHNKNQPSEKQLSGRKGPFLFPRLLVLSWGTACDSAECEGGALDFPLAPEQTAWPAQALFSPSSSLPSTSRGTLSMLREGPLGPALRFPTTTKLRRGQLLISPDACALSSTFSIKDQIGDRTVGSRWRVINACL